jgi:prevent-host-death family protein
MRVGIRELKDRLSELVERAAGGEVVTITHRGRAKAELRPLSSRSRLEQGIAEGRITPPTDPSAFARRDRKTFKSNVRTEDVIAEDRAERL